MIIERSARTSEALHTPRHPPLTPPSQGGETEWRATLFSPPCEGRAGPPKGWVRRVRSGGVVFRRGFRAYAIRARIALQAIVVAVASALVVGQSHAQQP